MPAVSDKVLNWLYSVLTNEYHDVNRTYSDVAEALSFYPSLSPRTEVYTFEDGTSALLLLLRGTIPVQFRGVPYRFPLSLWIPQRYPREPPIVYVTPAQGIFVRPGQHVSSDGRVYHPYLANFGKYWDKSSISDFLEILRGVFAKEPPVISQQQAEGRLPTLVQITPPPLPPPPEGIRQAQPTLSLTTNITQEPKAPPVPPKPGEEAKPPVLAANGQPSAPKRGPPPLPPLPATLVSTGTLGYVSQSQYQPQAPPPQPYLPQQIPMPPNTTNAATPFVSQQPTEYHPAHHDASVSPISPVGRGASRPVAPYQPPTFATQSQQAYPQPPDYVVHQQLPPPAQLYQPQPPPTLIRPTQPPIDLLSSPLDVTLPSQTGDMPTLPVPPVPPNPQKDALLHAISKTLVAQTRQVVESNYAAVAPLRAQQNALRNAHAVLTAELNQLQELDKALASNERILHETMAQADAVMRDAASKNRPNIDELLVCPTVVGGQLYELVADENACVEARVALGRGLDRGRIGLEVFVKTMRQIGREEFLRKALIRKAAKGMGLEMSGVAGSGNDAQRNGW